MGERVFKVIMSFSILVKDMGRAVATRGERKLGRTIRRLENSVELSSKEGKAKLQQTKYKTEKQTAQGYAEDSAIQNLRDPSKWKKTENEK